MEMTQTVEETVDDYDWFLELYGRKHYADERKKNYEEGEKLGLEKGEKLGLEKGEKLGLEKGEKLGLEKGEKLGLEKGRREEKENTILNMLRKKYPLNEISEITGIDREGILRIAKDNNLLEA